MHDADVFYYVDPSGYFAGFVTGRRVACISSVAYDDKFGFIGLYIVKPRYRGRGFGLKVWEKALEYQGGRNIALDGVVARRADYEKYGFRFAYRHLRFAGKQARLVKPSKNIIDLQDIEMSKILEYYSQMFPARRDRFIRRWVRQKKGRALGYLSGSRLAGYGVVRQCTTGFKVGPLFADDREIAEELLSGLAKHAGNGDIFVDVPEPNQQALDLVKGNGMKQVFETVRMYSKEVPRPPIDRIYGVTTLELG